MRDLLRQVRNRTTELIGAPTPRLMTVTLDNFDEDGYLEANPDVAEAVAHGSVVSGRRHYAIFGCNESRMQISGTAQNPIARYRSGARRKARLDDSMRSRVYDLEVQIEQLRDMLELVGGHSPPPPKHLQVRVVGNFSGGFVRSGLTSTIPLLNRALTATGSRIEDFQSMLDFGCGCGRSIFALSQAVPDASLHGTDIDAEAIQWLRDHHPKLASYEVTPLLPPMPYDDDSFDLVFGISVLTHLPEDMQFKWLDELARITKPGGYVVLTTHGEHHYSGFDENQRKAIDEHGFLYVQSGYGESISLPDFYESAYHSHDYIRREWSRYFEVLDVQDPVPGEHQDLVLLRAHPAA